MKIEFNQKVELKDTLVPDIFITEYMSRLENIDVKLYLYLIYICNNNIELSSEDICKNISITVQELSFSLDRLQTEQLILKTVNGFKLLNIKEQEIEKLYTPKLTPKKTKAYVQTEKIKTMAATSISESFFGGLMNIAWFNEIGVMFEKYKFEGEVMISLFHYCNEKKALNIKYVSKVAETWHQGGVKTFTELENYLDKMAKLQLIMQKISKALNLNRLLSKYEQSYVETWVNVYKYDFKIIEEALKRTIVITNPTFGYINAILTNWNKAGYTTLDEILTNDKNNNSKKVVIKGTQNTTNTADTKQKFKNYEQRKYDDLESYYDND